MAKDTSVGVATDYELDNWGSYRGKGKIVLFSIASRPALGSSRPPMQWVPGFFPRS
jgi:hypothetical protein